MGEEKVSRRRFIEIAGGTVVGLAVGAAAGYFSGTAVAPTVTQRITETVTVTPVPTPTPTPTPTPAPTPTPTPARRIKMGYTMGMTGFLATPNAWCDMFRMLWAETVNKKGGLDVGGQKMPVDLIKYDDRGSPDEASKYYERLATVDKVDAFLSTYGTFFAPAIDPIATKYKTPYIMSCGMPLPDLKASWTCWTPPVIFSSFEVIDILKKFGVSDVYLAIIETKFGLEFRRNLVEGLTYKDEVYEGLKDTGIKVVAEKMYPIGTTDFTGILLDVKDKNPDCFMQLSYPDDSFACTKQMIELDVNPKMYHTTLGLAAPVFYEQFTAEELEGVSIYGQTYVPGAPWKDPYIGSCRDFFNKFRERWGTDPDINDTNNGWAAISVMGQAIEKAGTIDKAAINEALHKEEFSTILGPMKFDEWGILTKDSPGHVATVLQWQNGELQITSPFKIKTADYIYPKPKWPK